ncbi:protein of unknown function [Paraburkholderia dioscoreae]|uniref:Uncharacterized protein n=1 Tax=Paraburkholderia dioscoreae TaxID=2604047 RepID=A0A5Q4ZDC7_9BURK|nr:protein of unknown function [Paraburkholderia dioscoreae]
MPLRLPLGRQHVRPERQRQTRDPEKWLVPVRLAQRRQLLPGQQRDPEKRRAQERVLPVGLSLRRQLLRPELSPRPSRPIGIVPPFIAGRRRGGEGGAKNRALTRLCG